MRLSAHCLVVFLLLAPSRASAAAPAGAPIAASPAHNYAQWENEVAAYEAQDRVSPPPQGGLLFAGSSTIRLWTTLAMDFPGHPVVNRGFGGTEIVDCTHFADRLIFPHAPRAIYLRSGTNDIHNGKTPAQVFADFKEFVAVVHARLPKCDIWYISLCPTIARLSETSANRELNGLVKHYAWFKRRVHFLNASAVSLDGNGRVRPELFREDLLHFNAAGYKLLAERVRPYLR